MEEIGLKDRVRVEEVEVGVWSEEIEVEVEVEMDQQANRDPKDAPSCSSLLMEEYQVAI